MKPISCQGLETGQSRKSEHHLAIGTTTVVKEIIT